MTDLEQAKALAQSIVEAKKEAIKTGKNKVTYEVFGRIRNEYYHSGTWNDRPATVSEYKGI